MALRVSIFGLVLLALLLHLGGAAPAAAVGAEDLVIEVVTDQAIYPPGQPVLPTAVMCNPTNEDYAFTFGCARCGRGFRIFDAAGTELAVLGFGGTTVSEEVVWPAGECIEESSQWNQEVYDPSIQEFVQVPDGEYTVVFEFDDLGPPNAPPPTSPRAFRIASGAVAIPTLSSFGVWGLVALLSVSAIVWLRRMRPDSQG